ncbi:hypothetical protein CEXT_549021 [Caerostris extrusa]|uniref:Uncharacterized protein n=1 Tax=Caerostris extrusa TaxID=172846 RepID=A0AAV4XVH6_CAEEX|nr:hypothetical protein CEXT_549021 [Caerostris extrusa]
MGTEAADVFDICFVEQRHSEFRGPHAALHIQRTALFRHGSKWTDDEFQGVLVCTDDKFQGRRENNLS